MSDMYLFFGSMFIFVTVYLIRELVVAWIEHRGNCDHDWGKWDAPMKGDGYPTQLRCCAKCNLHESRVVK